MVQNHVRIPSGNIMLEGAWHMPDGKGVFPAVMVCHPHTLYGGNMSNNVVVSICEQVSKQGIAALRFNFRGAGFSQGEFGDGTGEQDDVKAALTFMESDKRINAKSMGIAGYSFGAGVALSVAPQEKRVKALALISPPLEIPEWEALHQSKIPKLVIDGSEDSFFPAEQLTQYVMNLADPKEYDIIEGADHFWWGFESQISSKVAMFFKQHILTH